MAMTIEDFEAALRDAGIDTAEHGGKRAAAEALGVTVQTISAAYRNGFVSSKIERGLAKLAAETFETGEARRDLDNLVIEISSASILLGDALTRLEKLNELSKQRTLPVDLSEGEE